MYVNSPGIKKVKECMLKQRKVQLDFHHDKRDNHITFQLAESYISVVKTTKFFYHNSKLISA